MLAPLSMLLWLMGKTWMRWTMLGCETGSAFLCHDKFLSVGDGRTGCSFGDWMVENCLGPVFWDFNWPTVSFGEGNKLVTLKEQNSLAGDLCSKKRFAETLKKRKKGLLMSLSVSTKWTPPLTEANLSSSQQQQLEVLLCSFWSIFQPPRELPPKRILDHRIPLKEGTTPIEVKPYRCPYFQRMRSKSKLETFYILDSSNLHRALIRH